jgi:hypothetical protein
LEALMGSTPPLACTLDASQRPQRERDIRGLGRDALLAVERGAQTATLIFRAEPGVRERVEAIAEAESGCCAFLKFDVADGPDAIALTIVAPDGGEPMMNELAGMFAEDTTVAA